MVIPVMPVDSSASLTSSTLKGLMTAVTSLIWFHLLPCSGVAVPPDAAAGGPLPTRTPPPDGSTAVTLVGRVGLFAVDGEVADLEILVGHSQRGEQADDLQDDERHERVPDDDGERGEAAVWKN